MGLETGDRIPDLDINNPNNDPDQVTQGDDHLRLIKRCVLGSFSGLGLSQVTISAEQINATINKLQRFNGRTVTSVVPADNDYSATNEGDGSAIPGKLADFGDWSGVAVDDIPVWDGDKFLPEAKSQFIPEIVEYLHYDAQGLGATATRAVFFNGAANIDTITGSAVATVTNNGTAGFLITALKACKVDITFSDAAVAGGGQTAGLGIAVNGGQTTNPNAQVAGVLRAFTPGDGRAGVPMTASVLLATNDFVWINGATGFDDNNDSSVQAVVSEIIS